jgi:hypothetical protein
MLLLLTVSILVNYIIAHPIPTLDLDQCPPPSADRDTRSIWNIIWSSLVTLFACIWVAVHPNIPAFTDGTLANLKQRGKLLLTAVIAPEIIIMFSMRQWVCARNVMQSGFARGEGFVFLS